MYLKIYIFALNSNQDISVNIFTSISF